MTFSGYTFLGIRLSVGEGVRIADKVFEVQKNEVILRDREHLEKDDSLLRTFSLKGAN